MLGYKFNRQKPIRNYIVDIYCSKLSLLIEVDGYSHESEEAFIKDVERQKNIEAMGLKFIRVDDLEVKFNVSNVVMEIETSILNWHDLQANNIQNPPSPLC